MIGKPIGQSGFITSRSLGSRMHRCDNTPDRAAANVVTFANTTANR